MFTANYTDTYAVTLTQKNVTIEDAGRAFFICMPMWARKLLDVRNRIVRHIGLKAAPAPKNEEAKKFIWEPGRQVGPFKLYSKTRDELIMGEDDTHLDFRIFACLETQPNKLKRLSITTRVKFNNLLGRVYFFSILPFHILILRSTLKAIRLYSIEENKDRPRYNSKFEQKGPMKDKI